MRQLVAAGLGLGTQILGIVLYVSGMGGELSPASLSLWSGYVLCLPALVTANSLGRSAGPTALKSEWMGLLAGVAVWSSIWYLLIALAGRVFSRARTRAA